jgi:hypothetical protein
MITTTINTTVSLKNNLLRILCGAATMLCDDECVTAVAAVFGPAPHRRGACEQQRGASFVQNRYLAQKPLRLAHTLPVV